MVAGVSTEPQNKDSGGLYTIGEEYGSSYEGEAKKRREEVDKAEGVYSSSDAGATKPDELIGAFGEDIVKTHKKLYGRKEEE